MPRRVTLFALIAILSCSAAAEAQDDVGTRMSLERIGDIRPGTYTADEQIKFTLNHYLDRYLLRFANDPEVFVLYADHGSLGGRVLRYNSGTTALQVSGWGAITLYTDAEPSGLPAERTGDSAMPIATQVTLAQVQAAADDESRHLEYALHVRLSFDADWPALAGNSDMRAFAFDALQNAARGIERFAARAAARAALAARVELGSDRHGRTSAAATARSHRERHLQSGTGICRPRLVARHRARPWPDPVRARRELMF